MTNESNIPAFPFTLLKAEIHKDPDYAWGWQCNLAVPIMDVMECSHEDANMAAALIMSQFWGYDITKHPNYVGRKSPAQKYHEMRVEAERLDDEAGVTCATLAIHPHKG